MKCMEASDGLQCLLLQICAGVTSVLVTYLGQYMSVRAAVYLPPGVT